ncbi:MAG: DJ-1/PfpI family protein [Saprospiraceae bacterium]|jgi:protease I|nr:DJ-1/PfpI family protein [Saprospiraceae bacterium]MBK7372532.1 DJ-1/PfpI family protein [Saprospiraceae bacterium]MBK7439171.1 DJ-1/PfpI family protein [Saprospiraceae bacterium]MBK8282571.1 DJ-1/PfpI family protein [Saprospiraceae bacterium]MBK8513798.1 DJ-1/PfpI family protein [Saprospiraceae bacterium]
MSSKKILIITGDAGESFEVLYAKQRMIEAGHLPVIAAPAVKRMNLVIHDFEPGWDTYKESPGYQVMSDVDFDHVASQDYDAVICIGGRAPEYLRNDARVIRLVQEFNVQGKYIFAICHGIQILVTAGLVENKNITCYEHVKFEVTSCGGTYIKDQEAVQDGKIITGQTWQSHPEFYRLVMQSLA